MNQAEIRALCKQVLSEPVQRLKKLNKGLTNQNFLIHTAHHALVFRLPYADQSNIVNRAHEAAAMRAVAPFNLDFETLYFDPSTGVKMTRYVEAFRSFDETQAEARIERTATLMRRLHALNTTIGFAFDPIQRYRQYRSHVKKPRIEDTHAEVTLTQIQALKRPMTLCHNDWVEGNIGFTDAKDYLIDYEYAGDNDPYFDVMSFITENTLSVDEEQRFIEAYFQRTLDANERSDLELYRDLHNLLWCAWAVMMHESRGDPIYDTIATMKQNAYYATKKHP
jgi:thiamine kinase-like enzyme